ncbi:MAG: DUF4258 domain-containing protein [Gammaproteobacteria bacterium]
MRAEANYYPVSRAYSLTELCGLYHAAEELDDDNLTILDLENIILTGKIIARQRDWQTREGKCVIRGFTLDGLEAETIVKIGPTGRLVVITVYLA